MMEQTEGAVNKKRKKLKFELIEEGWGELQEQQGAGEEMQQAQAPPEYPSTREQGPETGEPPISLQQRRELSSPPKLGSPTYREQSLRQTRISEFLNPAALEDNPLDRPTLQNQGARQDSDLTATRMSGGRSPCIGDQIAVSNDGDIDKRFEGQTERKVGMDINVPTAVERGGVDVGSGSKVTKWVETGDGNIIVGEKVMPSSGKSENDCMLRKPMSTLGAGVNIVDNLDEEVKCVHKRGGFCTTHGSMGTKYVEKYKVWSKLKNGNFGYVSKSKTKYVCRSMRVAKSIEVNQTSDGRNEGVAKSDRENLSQGWKSTTFDSIEALEGPTTDIGMSTTLLGISGVDNTRAGSDVK